MQTEAGWIQIYDWREVMKLELDGKGKTKENARSMIGAMRNLAGNLEPGYKQDQIGAALAALQSLFDGATVRRLMLPLDIETPLRTIEGFAEVAGRGTTAGSEIARAADTLRTALEERGENLALPRSEKEERYDKA